MEAWEESLDIDDSDLSLRPCKRQTLTQTQTQTQIQILHNDPPPTPQTLEKEFLESPPATTSLRRLIPGPAGSVQTAIHRRMSNNQNPSSRCRGTEDLVPTQEYSRRVVENGDEHDDDFARNPWMCAADFVCKNGTGDGGGTPLSAIKNFPNTYRRIPQVVAMIKSCTPNGLGDLMVTLKDPTGTIGASIHQNVLTDEELGRNLSVGAVLILQKVVVFSPSRSAQYLNITLSNVIKVISKDSGPPSKQKNYASAIERSAASDCVGKAGMPLKAFSQVRGRIEGTLHDVRVSADVRGTTAMDVRLSNRAPVSGVCSLGNQNAAIERVSLIARHDLVEEIEEVAVKEPNNDNGLGVLPREESNPSNQTEQVPCTSTAANLVEFPSVRNQPTQPLISITSRPQWTDEQLEELFAVDSDNGDSLL